jgi:hypothetical protein
MVRKVRLERSGWRDEEFEQWHARNLFRLPAGVGTLFFLEYDKSLPVALVDYVPKVYSKSNLNNLKYKAIINMCDKAGIFFFNAEFSEDLTTWTIGPCNDKAKVCLSSKTEMKEKEWVDLLYKIRGRNMSEEEDWIGTIKPNLEKPAKRLTDALMTISERHREWGWNCPAFDLDCIVINQSNCVAGLVEYKDDRARPPRKYHPTLKALTVLGERLNVPIYVTLYKNKFTQWKIFHLLTLEAPRTLNSILGMGFNDRWISQEDWLKLMRSLL